MKPIRKQKLLTCPCCGQVRRSSEHHCFTNTNLDKYFIDSEGNKIEHIYWCDAKKYSLNWACDECLQNGRAVKANPNKQLFCDFQPYFAYFDKLIVCRDCGVKFTFNKEEQRHWYETIGFWVQSVRVRCKECQASKSFRSLLPKLLENIDYNDIDKVKQIIKLRLEFKQYRQAKHFLALGKKQYIKESEIYQVFESLKKQVDEAEKSALNP
jgi:hypothetical protein